MRTINHLLLAALVVVTMLPLVAAAGPPGPAAPIEPDLLDALASNGRADLLVHLSAQADLSAAYAIADWEARGAYVWDALHRVAEATQAPILSYAQRHGLQAHAFAAGNVVYVQEANLAAAHDLATLPGVSLLSLARSHAIVSDAPGAEPLSPAAVTSWGLIDAKAPDVWALGTRGAGAWVATIASGAQWQHPALIGSYGCPFDPGSPRCWWDPSNVCGGIPCDNHGHGTHMLGTVVADDDPDLPYIAGMAPDATWIACKGCESSSCSEYALLSCGQWVLAPDNNPANRPHVVLNPWGGFGGNPWYRNVVMAWVASGILGVFPAGGSGPGCANLSSPCDYPEVLCVTAHDQNRNPTSFASRGPGAFGDEPYTKPNISAPGVNIVSTWPTDGWLSISGTATASAHAAGAAALLVSGCPQFAYDPYGLMELLQDNADPPPPGNCGAPPGGQGNYTSGYGFLNTLAAVEACQPSGMLHVNRMRVNWRTARPPWVKVIALVRVYDQDGAAAEGALATGEWTYPDGSVEPQEAIMLTDTLGRTKFRVREAQSGLYLFCVTGIAKPGHLYDPEANQDGPCKEALVVP